MTSLEEFISHQLILAPEDAPALRRLQRAWLRTQIETARNNERICRHLTKGKEATSLDLEALEIAQAKREHLEVQLKNFPEISAPKDKTKEEVEHALIAARVKKLNSVTRNDGYFTKTSEVWTSYNRGRITMAQRDRAIRAIQSGLPFAIPQPKPAGVAKTPKGPVNLEDLA